MDMKSTLLTLLDAQSEAEVDTIIKGSKELSDSANWLPLDRRETNYNVTTNQQASGPKAATELMTNMVDAILLKGCRQAGLDPRSEKAPASMHDAVEKFVGIKGGRMQSEEDKWLADYASKNLVIGITGAKNKGEGFPSYTFADNGEGQYPEDFERTFLSLSDGNKKDIKFVQGKFNMGSSGVLSYCGLRWYKLIVSRKWDQKHPWGWTLMRRRPGGGMPVAEYFKLGGTKGKMPTADIPTLWPLKNRDKKSYQGFSLTTGTIVKLYDFQIGSKFLSFRGSREAFVENLTDTVLPLRIYDLRQTPDKKRTGDRALGVDARRFYGMEYWLMRSHADESGPDDEADASDATASADGDKINVAVIEDPQAGRVEISAIKLKRVLPPWLKSSNNRVFHAVNGQVQYKDTRGFLTTCKLPALKDRVVLVVDASKLSYEAHNDIWKSDRESIRETIVGERYKERVKDAIQSSKILSDLQDEVAREELKTAVDEQSNDLFQKLVEGDKNFASLLGNRDPKLVIKGMPGPVGDKKKSGGSEPDEEPFKGIYSPTFVTLDKRIKENGLELPINRNRPVGASTDVRNDYFVRDDNQGRLVISDPAIRDKFVIRTSLRNGYLTVYLQPIEERVTLGEEMTFSIGLEDDAMAGPVTDDITVRIAAVQEKPDPKPDDKKKDPKPKGGEKAGVGLPPYKLLTVDGREEAGKPTEQWPEGFTDKDGGYVLDLGKEGKMYYINLDNTYHQSYRRNQRGQILKDGITAKYILGMRVFLLGVERAIDDMPEDDGFDPDLFRKLAAKGAAATMLTLADQLPKIIMPVAEPE